MLHLQLIEVKYEFIFNQFVSLRKRFSVSPARELPTHVFHTPLARASLFAGYVYLRPHVAIKHSVKPTHEQSVLSSSSWQGPVKELNIYPIHSVSVVLVSVYVYVFPVVASLPPKGEERRPEIRLHFAGYSLCYILSK